jgi:hypothetical protein
MAMEFECRLDRRQAAAFLTERGYRTAPATLAKLACIGGGPVFESFGRRPLYREVICLLGRKLAQHGLDSRRMMLMPASRNHRPLTLNMEGGPG